MVGAMESTPMMEEKTPTKHTPSKPKEQVYSPIAYSPIAEYEAVPRASSSDFLIGTSVATSHASIRAKFLHKVFGILAMQLAVTTAACSCFMYVLPVRSFAVGLGSWYILLLCIASAAVLVGCFLYKHRSPANVAWLCAFTLITALLVGSICAQYQASGLGVLILEALGLALGIFVALSAYTLISKKDFPFSRGMIFVGVSAFIGSVVVNSAFGVVGGKRSRFLSMFIACTGAHLFCMYILWDVSKIILKLSVDEYVPGAIDLYLDVINVFLSVLKISSFLRH